MKRRTIFSQCRTYRYVLWREWDAINRAYALFVGLNPSTADEGQDDPTIRRCVGFAKRWGYGALCVTNLFAYRATYPEAMKAHKAPVGEENDKWLRAMAKNAAIVVAAWGVDGTHLYRDRAVIPLLGKELTCLGLTKHGHPAHPLYLKNSLEPIPFAMAVTNV
jgi:hypothetical protein